MRKPILFVLYTKSTHSLPVLQTYLNNRMPIDLQHQQLLDDILEDLHNGRVAPGFLYRIIKLGIDPTEAINDLKIIFGEQEIIKGLITCLNIIK